MPNPKYDEEGYVAPKSDDSDSASATRRRASLSASKANNVVKIKPKSKTVVTPGTKVSQATIDKIKAMGMKKALANASNASAEMREGLKRMYGANRVAKASPNPRPRPSVSTGGYPKPTKTSTRSASPAGGKASVLKSRDTGKVISTGGRGVTGAANLKPSSSSNSKTPTYRKPETISTGGRGVTGQGTMPRSTSKSTGKKTPNRMDILFGKK